MLPLFCFLLYHSLLIPCFFQGGREVDDFVSYVAKHATDELKAFDRKGKPKKEEL